MNNLNDHTFAQEGSGGSGILPCRSSTLRDEPSAQTRTRNYSKPRVLKECGDLVDERQSNGSKSGIAVLGRA